MLKLIKKAIKHFYYNKKKIFIYPILSGILLSLSYNYSFFWWLSLLALTPLISFFYKTKKSKKLLIGLFIFGFIFFGSVIIWLWKINVFAWSGISNFWMAKLILFFYWISYIVVVYILPLLILFWLFFKFKTKTYFDIFLFTTLWVLMEYSSTFFYSIICFGSDSLFGAHNTLGFLGYILASNYNLLQLAQFGGVYLLSFIIVFVNFLIYWIFLRNKSKNWNFRVFFIGILIIIMFFPFKIFLKEDNKNKDQEVNISALQTKDEAFFENDYVREKNKVRVYENLLSEIKKSNFDPDIIIFPEGSGFTQNLINNQTINDYYESLLGNKEKMVIDTSLVWDEDNRIKARLYYYDVKNKSMQKYDKLLFVPGGEYFPYSFSFIIKTIGFNDWLERAENRKYSKGSGIEIGNFKNKGIGGVSCFEIVSPEISRKMTKAGAQLFVNPTSHSSFNGNPILYHQIINITKVRAVENNKYFIQSGNYSPSSIVTNKGAVLTNQKKSPSIFNSRAYFNRDSTLYVRFGNWFVFLSFVLIFCFFAGFIIRIKNR